MTEYKIESADITHQKDLERIIKQIRTQWDDLRERHTNIYIDTITIYGKN